MMIIQTESFSIAHNMNFAFGERKQSAKRKKVVAIPSELWYVVLLQGGEHMNKLLETLYHSMYTPLEQVELQKEISSCHHQLTERLDKPEHKLLLKLVDDYDHLADMQSMDNFLCGLKLGLDLAYGLKHYDGHLLGDEAEEDVRRSVSE